MRSADIASSEMRPERTLPPVGRGKILFCSPDVATRQEVVAALSKANFSVIIMNGAESTFELIELTNPHLILTDADCPAMDGLAFMHRLRGSRPDYDHVPFVVISRFADASDVIAGMGAGADLYLPKPIDAGVLVAIVEAQLRQVRRVQSRGREVLGRDAETSHDALTRALDLLDFGVLLIDLFGHVRFSNIAACKLMASPAESMMTGLERMIGIDACHGTLAAARAARLRKQTFQRAFFGSSQGITIDDARAEDLNVVVFTDLGFGAGEEGTMMVMVTRAGGFTDAAADLITAAARLTPAETAIAARLARGERLSQISEALSISRNTVNFHLRHIFQKTTTARQSDLISLMRSVHVGARADAETATAAPASSPAPARRTLGQCETRYSGEEKRQ